MKRTWVWASFWVLLNIADYLITVIVISKGGFEANSFLAALSPPLLSTMKYIVPILILPILYASHWERILPALTCGMAVIVYFTGMALLI
jgi:hypothetical protein